MQTNVTEIDVVNVGLTLLQESPRNPRRSMDAASLKELASSIKESGVMSPLLVRAASGKDIGIYEIICGHRRAKAAKIAGLDTVPCIVRKMEDAEAAEIALVENLQRVDLHPLDEAEGYQEIFAQAGAAGKTLTPADVALRVGKSESYVRLRLKLRSTVKAVQEALRGDKITLGHALELARFDAGVQEKLLHWVLYWQYGLEDSSKKRPRDEAQSLQQLRQHIHDEYLLDLAKAPFDTKDAQLVPAAGACVDCSKRTGNDKMLFADVKRGDTCTDPRCFDGKIQALVQIEMQKMEERGWKCVRISSNYTHTRQPKALHPNDYNVLEKHTRNAATDCDGTGYGIFIDGELRGRTVRICVAKNCKIHGYLHGSGNMTGRDEAKKKRVAAAIETEARKRIFSEMVATAIKAKPTDQDYLALAEYAVFRADSSGVRKLVQALGWGNGGGWDRDDVRKKLRDVGVSQAVGIARLAAVSGELTIPGWGDMRCDALHTAAKDYGVDVAKIRAQVKAEKTKPAAKKAAKAIKKKTAGKKPVKKTAAKVPALSAVQRKRIAIAQRARWAKSQQVAKKSKVGKGGE